MFLLVAAIAVQVLAADSAMVEEQVTVTCTLGGETASTFTAQKQALFLSIFDYISQGDQRKSQANIVGIWLAHGDNQMLSCAEGLEYPCDLRLPAEGKFW